ncbi:LysR family transcriptional regulator [Uliginosibacterium gangwonense]|uniref:LysR family transcriptional regulator n=1 Tax=Uliginosibacterium gangwonense TaxID=392736 RepID=UPI00035FC2B7|nr:LysR family transcriptional regulator [Uliginosibacterium gangwonense]
MDRFQAMQLFSKVVEFGSFTRAADELHIPRATASHTIKQLERRLGVSLLHRTTRAVSVTLDGNAYYQRCLRLLADLEDAESAFATRTIPKGILRVELQPTIGLHFVIPRLPEFHARFPQIQLEVSMGDRLVDLLREGIDCAVRVGELGDSPLVGRRLALLEQLTCASPAYLASQGRPDSIEEFMQHAVVNYFSTTTGKPAPFDFCVAGRVQSILRHSDIAINNAEGYVACARAGLGIIQAPRHHVAADLACGALCEIMSTLRPPPVPVSILYPYHAQLSTRLRAFIDWLAEVFSSMQRTNAVL